MKPWIIVMLCVCFPALGWAAHDPVKEAPFGNKVTSSVLNYNRATPKVATSGVIAQGGVKELARYGFRTIIDLRDPTEEGASEEAMAARRYEMYYVNIPVTKEGVSDEQLKKFVEAMEDVHYPVLVHCASGNRVGAMWARYRYYQETPKELALEQGRTAGLQPSMEKKVRASMR
jgi:uncharacterized protein (TIGR01244 family)